MDFGDIDFKGGKCRFIEPLGQDMLEVHYPGGYMIDLGYIEDTDTFYITVIKNGDWTHVHKEIPAKTQSDLKSALRYAIDYVTRLS